MSATPKTMKAVVIHGIGKDSSEDCNKYSRVRYHDHISEDYRMEERPVPVPGPGEVLVKVEAVGICAGDSKCWAGAARFWGKFILLSQNVPNPHCHVG